MYFDKFSLLLCFTNSLKQKYGTDCVVFYTHYLLKNFSAYIQYLLLFAFDNNYLITKLM